MDFAKIIVIFSVPLFLTACGASLNSKRVDNVPVQGVVYSLPLTVFTGSVSYRPTSCEDDQITISSTVTAESSLKTDANHVYSISPSDISKFWNKSSADVEFHEDTLSLKAINSSIDDQVVELTSKFVSAGISIAKGNLGALPVIPPPPGKVQSDCEMSSQLVLRCKSEVIEAFKTIEDADNHLAKVTADLTESSNELLILEKEIADLGDRVSDSKLEELSNLKAKIRTRMALVSLAKSDLAKAEGSISASQSFNFPDSSYVFKSDVFKLDINSARKWVEVVKIKPKKCGDEETVQVSDNFLITELNLPQQDVRLEITSKDDYSVLKYKFPGCEKIATESHRDHRKRCFEESQEALGGIFYRNPRPGELVAVYPNLQGKKVTVLSEDIQQLGYVNSLKFSTKTLESAKLSATFSAKGYVTKYGYEQTESIADNLGSLVEGVTSSYEDYKESKRTAQQEALDAELKKLQTQKSIIDAQISLSADAQQTGILNAELNRVRADIELIEARSALENAGQ